MRTHGPTTHEAQLIAGHVDYPQGLVSAGTIVLAGRTLNADEHTFGIVEFGGDSEAAALKIVHEDPAACHGVVSAE